MILALKWWNEITDDQRYELMGPVTLTDDEADEKAHAIIVAKSKELVITTEAESDLDSGCNCCGCDRPLESVKCECDWCCACYCDECDYAAVVVPANWDEMVLEEGTILGEEFEHCFGQHKGINSFVLCTKCLGEKTEILAYPGDKFTQYLLSKTGFSSIKEATDQYLVESLE
jgi:hypothetical protein